MRRSIGRALPLFLGGLLLTCTDARLQADAGAEAERYDNLLRIDGEVCTPPPDELIFPVKVLFVIDESASLQCMDSQNRRFVVLGEAIEELLPLPNVQIGLIGFANWIRVQPFTRNLTDIMNFINASGLGPATDYQGALATTAQVLEQDMISTDAAERARTRYVVVFISDGVPEPMCQGGCPPGEPAICSANRSILDDDEFVEMARTGCPEYNTPRLIYQRVEDVRNLRDVYGAGDLVLNTVLMFSPTEVVESVCPGAGAEFGYEIEEARPLLRGMAQAGGGVFRDANLEQEDDNFLDFNFVALESPYWLAEVLAVNLSARYSADGRLLIDSDMDGLPDELERRIGTDPYDRDTDGDGYSDLFEYRFREHGFDPLDPSVPRVPCSDDTDYTGDGLKYCEEAWLGTDPRNPDTDGDRIPDWVELLFGTDPLEHDIHEDPSMDGRLNREAIRAGFDPMVDSADMYRLKAILYRLEDLGTRQMANRDTGDLEERQCQSFSISRIPLGVTTMPGERGLNRILIYAASEPRRMAGSADFQVACVEAYYQGDTIKDPPSGRVALTQDWLDGVRSQLDARFERLASCAGQDPEELRRGHLEDAIERCMPRRIALGRILHHREELVSLLRRYVNTGLSARLPALAADVFHPMAVFDPTDHCMRPWEVARLHAFLDAFEEACRECPPPGDDE